MVSQTGWSPGVAGPRRAVRQPVRIPSGPERGVQRRQPLLAGRTAPARPPARQHAAEQLRQRLFQRRAGQVVKADLGHGRSNARAAGRHGMVIAAPRSARRPDGRAAARRSRSDPSGRAHADGPRVHAGDVEMRPGDLAREVPQESGGVAGIGEEARRPAAPPPDRGALLQVGDVGVEIGAVLPAIGIGQSSSPTASPGGREGRQQRRVGAEQPGAVGPSAVTIAPVSVARSMIARGFNRAARGAAHRPAPAALRRRCRSPPPCGPIRCAARRRGGSCRRRSRSPPAPAPQQPAPGSARSASASIAPAQAAAPAMSARIAAIPAAGLMEMPPVSKQSPLPMKATGGASHPPGPAQHDQPRRVGALAPRPRAARRSRVRASRFAAEHLDLDAVVRERLAAASAKCARW